MVHHKQARAIAARPSKHRSRRQSGLEEQKDLLAPALTTLFCGISAIFGDSNTAEIAIAIHDYTYLFDLSVQIISLPEHSNDEKHAIADYVVSELEKYAHENMCKFIGAGLPHDLAKRTPELCSRLWLDLDIIPISLSPDIEEDYVPGQENTWIVKGVEEQADSMARKCIIYFGPSRVPLQQVGYRGVVEVDLGGRARILALDDFQHSCGAQTWDALSFYVGSLKKAKTKIAFFSSTPQGGGVALMRHALLRLAKLWRVDITWYVPKPKPGVFRITKTVHNILQGVAASDVRISAEEKQTLTDWITDNANRSWFSENGPLRPAEEGGADVIMIDDPQMPGLIPLIKKLTPDRPVLYRSHIEIRSDLVAKEGSPQADIWEYLWSSIKHADMFISHPIPSFVPKNVPKSMIGYLPATTDWCDGLNKEIHEWDMRYYGHLYNEQCHSIKMTELRWPKEKYFVQVARFDPAKGIPDVIESYAEFRKLLSKDYPEITPPQLVICGNGSVDDPDGTVIFDETMATLEHEFPHLLNSISVMRLSSNDQLLNVLLSASHTVLQLSIREGFEVKVSEALHKGKPVIATDCGGIPLQIQHGKNGYLVRPRDHHAIAKHLLELYTDDGLYKRMSEFARNSVSDEVGTAGNALSWMYLADKWANGGGVKPEGRWINDLAREEAGLPYIDGENKLPRDFARSTKTG